MTQNEIIQGCKAGRETAYRALVDTYAHKLMGLCVRYLRDRQKAEDAVQETFIQVFRSVDQFDASGNLIGWMSRIAINICLKELKKSKRMVFTEQILHLETLSVMPEIYRKMKTEELLAVLDNLPPPYRIVFNLHLVEGYSHKEISALLDIRESTSRTKLTRARKMLQDYLFFPSKKSVV